MTRARLILALLLVSACATTAREPVLPALREARDRPIVVMVPGISGTTLRDKATGEIVWGDFRSFFLPRDGGRRLVLPMGGEDNLEPGPPIMEIKAGPYKKEVYGTVARLMERNGYERGELTSPGRSSNFFFFDYDWRRDNIDSARLLARQLARLGSLRGGRPTRVALICQSNAGYICRYLVRWGDVSLEEAEEGMRRPPAGIIVEKVILVGTANGGALRILREMNRGRRYVKLVGRTWQPETLFTFRSLFQDLPALRDDLFVDHNGDRLEIDLFDAESWRRHGWSIYREPARRHRVEDAQFEYLKRNLSRARRFHALLASDSGPLDRPRYYSIGSLYTKTPDRALILPTRDGFETLFTGDEKVLADPYIDLVVSEPGDKHATRGSQDRLSAPERRALVRAEGDADGDHFEMITRPAAQRVLLEMLAE